MGGIDVSELFDRRERMGQRALGIVDRPPVGGDQPTRMGSCGLGRHLLAQHRAHGEFGLVDRAGNPLPRCLGDHRRKFRVIGQRVDDRLRVGIEVQQPPATGDRGCQVTEVVEHERAADVIDGGRQRDYGAAEGKTQAASVRTVADLLATGHGAGGQMTEDALVGERACVLAAEGRRPPATWCRTPIGPLRACVAPSGCFRTPGGRCR